MPTYVVTLEVDADELPGETIKSCSSQEIRKAVFDAISEIVNYGMNRGFNHDLDDCLGLSVKVDKVRLKLPKHECNVCGRKFYESEMKQAMYVDGADVAQPMDVVWVCDTCYKRDVNADGWGWSNDYASPADYVQIGQIWVGPDDTGGLQPVYVLTEEAWDRLYQGRNGLYADYRSYYEREIEEDE